MLGELIKILEAESPDLVVRHGFGDAHSYRGDYSELGVSPQTNVTVGEMLATLRGAIGQTFQGYKGGDYTMGEWTTVYLAEWGCTGEQLGPGYLRLMLEMARKEQTDA